MKKTSKISYRAKINNETIFESMQRILKADEEDREALGDDAYLNQKEKRK